MSWNADNTVWSIGASGPTLTHTGNGSWQLITHSLGRSETEVEDGNMETAYFDGDYGVIWEYDGGYAHLQTRVSGSNYGPVTINHTFSGNGAQDVYIGFGGDGHDYTSSSTLINWSQDITRRIHKISIPEVNPDNPATTGATHRVNVNARNVDHWSWSLDGGPDNMMPPGSTYADITIS